MKKFTFITPFGVFTSLQPSLKDAFKEVCINDPRITMATLNGGTISHLNDVPCNVVQVLQAA